MCCLMEDNEISRIWPLGLVPSYRTLLKAKFSYHSPRQLSLPGSPFTDLLAISFVQLNCFSLDVLYKQHQQIKKMRVMK